MNRNLNRKKEQSFFFLFLFLLVLTWWLLSLKNDIQPTIHAASQNDPVSAIEADTRHLLALLQADGLQFDKGLWEALAAQSGLTQTEALRLAEGLKSAFSLPESRPVHHSDGVMEWLGVRELNPHARFSLRLLAIPRSGLRYEIQLIAKLESTSADWTALHPYLSHMFQTINGFDLVPEFYACVRGSGNGKLEDVAKNVLFFFTREKGQIADHYEDEYTRSFRYIGEVHAVHALIHWNGAMQKTEVELGTPYLITEF